MTVDEERRAGDDARQAAVVLERKRATLQTELEDVRALLETVRVQWRGQGANPAASPVAYPGFHFGV